MSTTRGYPAPSRSSTVHCVEAPVPLLVTVSTVPKGSVGLAHIPGAASEYHVASPASWLVATGAGGAVVVVVGGGGGGADTTGATVVVVVGTGAGAGGAVVAVGGAVVDVVCGAWYTARCEDRFTPPTRDAEYTALLWARNAANAVAGPRDACAVPLCSKRKGKPNDAPHRIAATPRRLPRVLCFRRAPPFSGDSAPAPTQEAARGS
jgi:hypothetical protein